jgi:hypothetical protein
MHLIDRGPNDQIFEKATMRDNARLEQEGQHRPDPRKRGVSIELRPGVITLLLQMSPTPASDPGKSEGS